jgi:hypothetical protein
LLADCNESPGCPRKPWYLREPSAIVSERESPVHLPA